MVLNSSGLNRLPYLKPCMVAKFLDSFLNFLYALKISRSLTKPVSFNAATALAPECVTLWMLSFNTTSSLLRNAFLALQKSSNECIRGQFRRLSKHTTGDFACFGFDPR